MTTAHQPAEPGRGGGGVDVPVIAIDGPTASGKGTIAAEVARRLGFHYLDSGALYRLVAFAAQEAGVDVADEPALARIARNLKPLFQQGRVQLAGRDVSDLIRQENVCAAASQVAALPAVRSGLVQAQRGFRVAPGLVADGRDMGTVIFPDATLKVFLTADVESRAGRRHKQLIEKGFSSNISSLLRILRERDDRDANREVAPLRAASDAVVIDSTHLSIEQTIEQVLGAWQLLVSVGGGPRQK